MIAALASWSITSRGRAAGRRASRRSPPSRDPGRSTPPARRRSPARENSRTCHPAASRHRVFKDVLAHRPRAPSINAGTRTGRMVAKKPRPGAGGVVRVRALLLDQRAQPPDTPPRGVVVVVTVIRSRSLPSSRNIAKPTAQRQGASPKVARPRRPKDRRGCPAQDDDVVAARRGQRWVGGDGIEHRRRRAADDREVHRPGIVADRPPRAARPSATMSPNSVRPVRSRASNTALAIARRVRARSGRR
jgi:hypothetical protein